MTKLSHFKKGAIAAALIAGVSFAGTASAGTMAQATLTLNNFVFKNNATNTILSNSDFSFITFTDSSTLTTQLNGVQNSPATVTVTNGPPLGQTVACVPVGCAGLPSATPFAPVAPPPTTNGAMAASNLTGAPVSGLPGGATTPATAQTSGLAELANSCTASTTSKLTLQSTFSFVLASATTVLVDFNTIVHTMAYLSQIGTQNFAQANDSWNIVISQNGLQFFTWTPDGVLGTGITGGTEVADQCNMQAQVGLFVAPAITQTVDCGQGLNGGAGGHEAATVSLAGQTLYTLTLTHVSNSQAQFVPEPESVMLMGLGLVGLALARRRAVRKS